VKLEAVLGESECGDADVELLFNGRERDRERGEIETEFRC